MARRAAGPRPPGPDFSMEAAHGGGVAGVDEAGRGPLAGPVMAAAVLFHAPPPPALTALLDDSKRLDARRREAAHAALLEAKAAGTVLIGVGAASAAEIGRLNILRATHLAMARAVARLGACPALALVDGNAPPPLGCPVRCVVGGDGLSFSIAAASIMAKVIRDRAMARLDPRWPGYGFGRHAGYPTAAHREALARLGPSPHHRRGFGPVDRAWVDWARVDRARVDRARVDRAWVVRDGVVRDGVDPAVPDRDTFHQALPALS